MARFHVQRSTHINASAEKVFETVADFGTWSTWSPWLCCEPAAEVTVTESPNTVSSVYTWRGEIVGQGEIEHRRLDAPRHIEEELRFIKPFPSKSKVTFDIKPSGEGTEITWDMHGSLPWFLFWMRSQMVAMIGMDYERGLKMLKEWIETGEVLSQTVVHGVEPVGPLRVAGVRNRCSLADIGASMTAAFDAAVNALPKHGLPLDGEPISVYHQFDLAKQTCEYTSGFAVPESASVPSELSTWSLPQGRALHVEHGGRYEHLGNSWSAAQMHMRYKKLKPNKCGAFEIYRNDPCATPPAELRTDIFLPLK
ncbi:MAG: SRPBCC family protein [Planctomycetales bacterium]|nr:SRPBCC family protein [Planctomycetales bacterium]